MVENPKWKVFLPMAGEDLQFSTQSFLFGWFFLYEISTIAYAVGNERKRMLPGANEQSLRPRRLDSNSGSVRVENAILPWLI